MNVLVRPAELYNSMVHPLLPLSARGVVWYQGEGNWGDYPIYPLLMKTLINGWRRNFAHSEMPFYYVQIAPWGFGQDTLLERVVLHPGRGYRLRPTCARRRR